VGNDLLTGHGIAKFTAIRTLVAKLKEAGHSFDYVMIDLPPSFGGLVRSSLYSSEYLIIPCTSDTFSE
jgi:chromosome partitioning protein